MGRRHRLLEGFYWFHTGLIKQSPRKGMLNLCRLNKDFDSYKALGPLHTAGTVKGAVVYLNERASAVPQSQPRPRVTCGWQPPSCFISCHKQAFGRKRFFAVSCLLFILTCLWGYGLAVSTKPSLWSLKLPLKVGTQVAKKPMRMKSKGHALVKVLLYTPGDWKITITIILLPSLGESSKFKMY